MAPTTFLIKTTSEEVLLNSHNAPFLSTSDGTFEKDRHAEENVPGPSDLSDFGTPAPSEVHEQLLRFTTEHTPRDPSVGFVFGSDAERCDVLLHPSWRSGISRRHFAVAFNHQAQALLLKNLSKHMTAVWDYFTCESIHLTSQRAFLQNWSVGIKFPRAGIEITLLYIQEPGFEEEYEPYFAALNMETPNLQRMRLQTSTARTPNPGWTDTHLLQEALGSGTYGIVHRATCRQSGEVVAIKCFHNKYHGTTSWMEGKLLSRLRHENIIRFHEFVLRDQEPPKLIMEFAPCGDMLRQHQTKPFSGMEGKLLVKQVLQGLQYLHHRNIVHRDLKPANILIASREPMLVKLGDFGSSGADRQEYNSHCGTVKYQAPEMVRPPLTYTSKVDIWALGVIVAELWLPLPDFERHDLWFRELSECRSNAPGLLQSFLGMTLQEQPEIRQTAAICLQSAFLQVLDSSPQDSHPVLRNHSDIPDTAPWETTIMEQEPARTMRPAVEAPNTLSFLFRQHNEMKDGTHDLPDDEGVALFVAPTQVMPKTKSNEAVSGVQKPQEFVQEEPDIQEQPSQYSMEDLTEEDIRLTLFEGKLVAYSPRYACVNLTHIVVAAGLHRQRLRDYLNSVEDVEQRIVRSGSSKLQGTYIRCKEANEVLQTLGLNVQVQAGRIRDRIEGGADETQSLLETLNQDSTFQHKEASHGKFAYSSSHRCINVTEYLEAFYIKRFPRFKKFGWKHTMLQGRRNTGMYMSYEDACTYMTFYGWPNSLLLELIAQEASDDISSTFKIVVERG